MPARALTRPSVRVVGLVLVSLVVVGCGSGRSGGPAVTLRGRNLEVLAVWSGAEQDRFQRVIEAFERQTGASVSYVGAGHTVPETLAADLARGQPPDVAFLPQPGVLRQYAEQGALVPLDGLVGDLVTRNYPPVWRQLGSVGGRLYGVWFKAADKSLIWYNVGVFERAGIVPPADIDKLLSVARTLSGLGTPAFSVGGGDRWTLTDWFENLYLRLAGPQRYDLLTQHRIPWTDQSVKDTLRLLSTILSPQYISGGISGALKTGYEASVEAAFTAPPSAAMVFEGDFVSGVITARTRAELGVDADVFPFPSIGQSGTMVVGGGDAAVLLRRTAAGTAFLRFLASPDAAAIWAAQGGYVSPNVNVDLSAYPEGISRSIARQLLEAGDEFRFDLSDQEPEAFGGSGDQSMGKLLADFLVSRDVEATATRLEAAAAAAFAGP